jgi:hypothetical protein
MAGENLRSWFERVLGGNPSESPVKQIQLSSEAAVYMTWDAPFSLEALVTESETILAQLAEELPTRKVPCSFIATGIDGAVRGSTIVHVHGKNKNAGELSMGATAQASRSFAEAMETMVRVVNVVLKSAEIQVSSLTKTCESQANQLHEMHEYNRLRAELELVNGANEKPDITAQLGAQLTEAAPVLIEALKVSLAQKSEDLAKAAAARIAATPASATTTNNAGAH